MSGELEEMFKDDRLALVQLRRSSIEEARRGLVIAVLRGSCRSRRGCEGTALLAVWKVNDASSEVSRIWECRRAGGRGKSWLVGRNFGEGVGAVPGEIFARTHLAKYSPSKGQEIGTVPFSCTWPQSLRGSETGLNGAEIVTHTEAK
jgi:hypothetical protein